MRSKNAIILDTVCRRYSTPPSVYFGIKDISTALDFDIAICYRGLLEENRYKDPEKRKEMEIQRMNEMPFEKDKLLDLKRRLER